MNPYSNILDFEKVKLTPAQETIRTAFLEYYSQKAFYDIDVKSSANARTLPEQLFTPITKARMRCFRKSKMV